MRLRIFVALEIAVGLVLVAAMGVVSVAGFTLLQNSWTQSALAATVSHRSVVHQPIRAAEPAARLSPPSVPPLFDGVQDSLLLEPLRHSKLAKIKFNRGGSSISLRMDFANGSRAAFKPRQTNSQTIPRKEIAAFRVNRMLGLASVPPAIGRRFRFEELTTALTPGSRVHLTRMRQEILLDRGRVGRRAAFLVDSIDCPCQGEWSSN